MSNLNTLIESPYATYFLMTYCLPHLQPFSEMSAVEMCMALTLTFKVKCKYAIRKDICDFIYAGNGNICPQMSLFQKYLQWKYARPRSWRLEWAEVKCKYANWNVVRGFLFVGSSNVCSICHRLEDIHIGHVDDLTLTYITGLRSSVNVSLYRLCVNSCVGNGNVCPICHRFRDINHVWTSQCTRFEWLT